MGVFEDKDGYLIFTHDWSKIPTEKTYIIMATKIQKWWKLIYYKILIEKAHKTRNKDGFQSL
jgi:hypothetical protein